MSRTARHDLRAMLLGEAHRAALADDRDADLAGVGEIFFYFPGDVPAQQVSGVIVHIIGIDHDAEFPPGLDGVGLGNAVKGSGNVFQILKTLDIVFQQFLARSGPCAGQRIRGLNQNRKRGFGAHILMMGGNGMDDILAFSVLFGDIRADDGVRAFHLMIHGLADVMQQTGPLGPLDIHAQFGGHHAAQGGDFK